MRAIELLAPARDLSVARVAIDCGADAVYIGAAHHGARAAAANSIDDIAEACRYAHQFRAKVYVTLNTLVYDNELDSVVDLTWQLWRAGVDALIVQDMSLLRLPIAPIALHASTQADLRTPEKAAFAEAMGFSQIVIPRESSLDEIRAYADVLTVPIEAFVHGALCVSYSGDCRASLLGGGRSANRGECAQICRLAYNLTDKDGNVLVKNRHLLSLRDLNRLADLEAMADAGVSSFKIEGRLKDAAYVANVTRAYSEALDRLCAAAPERYHRASAGTVSADFEADISKVFNRGFTSYFLRDTQPKAQSLSSSMTPKFTGEKAATVISAKGNLLIVKALTKLNNGDGLVWFDSNDKLQGLRINRVEGNTLHLAAPVSIPAGTALMRNSDAAFDRMMASAHPRRTIAVCFTLRRSTEGTAVLDVSDDRGCSISVSDDTPLQIAKTPQIERRRDTLERLGNTIYKCVDVDDRLGDDVFIAASALTALRRRALEVLDHAAEATRQRDRRLPEDKSRLYITDTLTFHDNVANREARRFYEDHGVKHIETALEINPLPSGDTEVMCTRYCLRRELGACLRTPAGRSLPTPLFLRETTGRLGAMRLDFDCAACRMHVVAARN